TLVLTCLFQIFKSKIKKTLKNTAATVTTRLMRNLNKFT
ncbi:secA DEAD-like domain protein, partial [Vibrio harveyi]